MHGMAGVAAALLTAFGGAAALKKQGPPGWLPADASWSRGDSPVPHPWKRNKQQPQKLGDDHSTRISGSIGHLREVASQLHDLQVELVNQRKVLDQAEAEKASAQAELAQASKEAANVTRTKAALVVKIDDIFKELNMFPDVGDGSDSKKILNMLYEKRNMQKKLTAPPFDDSALMAAEAENAQLKATLAQQRQAKEKTQQILLESQQHEAALAEAQLSNVSLAELTKRHEKVAAIHEGLLAEQKKLDDALQFASQNVGSIGEQQPPAAASAAASGPTASAAEDADAGCESELKSVRAQIMDGMQTTSDLNKALEELVVMPA